MRAALQALGICSVFFYLALFTIALSAVYTWVSRCMTILGLKSATSVVSLIWSPKVYFIFCLGDLFCVAEPEDSLLDLAFSSPLFRQFFWLVCLAFANIGSRVDVYQMCECSIWWGIFPFSKFLPFPPQAFSSLSKSGCAPTTSFPSFLLHLVYCLEWEWYKDKVLLRCKCVSLTCYIFILMWYQTEWTWQI